MIPVLFLSPFFYPEEISTGKYNTLLVQALVNKGAEVNVVCSHPLYPEWRPVRTDKTLEGVTVHRGGAWIRYPRLMVLRRLVFELWFTAHAMWETWRLGKCPTTVVAVFPPSLFLVMTCRLLPRSIKRVGIVHDLQGVLAFGDGRPMRRLLRRIVHAVEKRGFQACSTLVALSHAMARTLIDDYGVEPEGIVVRYPFATLKLLTSTAKNLISLLPDGHQHVVYSGALGRKQNPHALFEFFQTAAARLPAVHFHIFSAGPIFEEVRRSAWIHPAERVHLHELVCETDLEELYARSTVQVIPQLEGSSDACLPSKLPNILAAGCAVFAICDPGSELASIIRSTFTGVVAETWHMDSLMKQLERVLDQTGWQTRTQRQEQTRQLICNEFSLESLVDTILGPSNRDKPSFAVSNSWLRY